MRLPRIFAAITAIPVSAALPILVAGCPSEPPNPPADGGSDAPPACTLEYIGDKAADIEVEIVTLDPSYTAHPLMAGGDASILIPPQGGRVIFAGVRAKNLDPCGVVLAGALRDPASQQIRLDTRSLNLDLGADGWGQSDETDISTFSNIPVCGNTWAMTDIFDQSFELVVSVRDRDGKKKEMTVNVVPRCDEMKVEDGIDIHKACLCLCKGGYVTGEACDVKP